MLDRLAISVLPTLRQEPPACLPVPILCAWQQSDPFKTESKPANGIKTVFTCSPSTAASLPQGLSSYFQPNKALHHFIKSPVGLAPFLSAGSSPEFPPRQTDCPQPSPPSPPYPNTITQNSLHTLWCIIKHLALCLISCLLSVCLSHWKGTLASRTLQSSGSENKHLAHGRHTLSGWPVSPRMVR